MPLTESVNLVLANGQPVPVDLYRSNVSLLLHGDGANNSTTITDSSPTPLTPNVFGDSKISTAQSKFGGSSIYLDGTGDYLGYASNNRFGFGTTDFTIEAWAFLASTGDRTLFSTDTLGLITYPSGNSGGNQMRLINNAGTSLLADTTAFPTSTWTHVAVCRAASTIRLFISGTQVASASNTVDYGSSSTARVGSWMTTPPQFVWNGYIDDLRITKGVARYTANFTPPTAPFPDF